MHKPLVPLGLAALAVLGACKGGDEPGSTADSKTGPASAGSTATASEGVTPPAEVTGAFLTSSCGDFNPLVDLVSGNGTVQMVGCILKDKNGQRVPLADLANLSVKVNLNDGSTRNPTPRLSPQDIGWNLGLPLDKADAPKVANVTITGTYTPSGSFSAEASNITYDPSQDAAFGERWLAQAAEVLFEVARLAPDQNCQLPSGYHAAYPPGSAFVWPPPAAFLKQPYHIVFYTTALQNGNLGGLAGADQICATAGKGIDPSRTWLAALSTTKVNAKDRFSGNQPVFNTQGWLIAATLNDFWNPLTEATVNAEIAAGTGSPTGYVEYTLPADGSFSGIVGLLQDQCGYNSTELSNPALPFTNTYRTTWTGTAPGGTYDATNGSCSDWTSAEATATAAAGRATDPGQNAFDDGATTCDSRAFLYCISQ